jgi:hypothetical protein
MPQRVLRNLINLEELCQTKIQGVAHQTQARTRFETGTPTTL